MGLRVFFALFFMLFLFRSSGILAILNHVQTVLLLLFGSKESVPKHNIFHEDAKPPGNFYTMNDDNFYRGNMDDNSFYSGNMNENNFYRRTVNNDVDDVDECGSSCFTRSRDNWNLFKYTGLDELDLQDMFQLVLVVLVIAPFLHIALSHERKRHRRCCKNCKIIGKLHVSSTEIAKGSNGTVVFEGIYEGRKVAVKRLVKAHNDVAFTEIRNLIASDQHPNIVHWYGWEHDHDFVYLSLERCACSLDNLILNKMYPESFQLWKPNDYPSPVLLNLMRDIVVGLVHLHDLGIIHRDLKPNNVLIVIGKSLCGKISDMGISRRLVGDMSSLGHHVSGSGSSGWQAPEQLCHGRQTRAVDLFSLGCVLFFCLTRGKHPFGDHLERDINVINNKKVNLFLVQHIPEAMDLFSRLLNFDHAQRPKASEVLHHPLFWSSETRMSFLRDTSDQLESEGRKGASVVLTALETECRIALCGKWNAKMEPAFISHIQRYRYYKYKSVRDLLRAIRNTLNHYRGFPQEIKESLGSVPEGPDDYFRSKFPKLLMEVYNIMYRHCKQEDWFRKYLES